MTTLSPLAVAKLARSAGFSPAVVPVMVGIAMAESGGVVEAVGPVNGNGTTDYGLWQINSVHGFDKSRLTSDPAYNASAAFSVYKRQGLTAWATYNGGKVDQAVVRQVKAETAKPSWFDNVVDTFNGGKPPANDPFVLDAIELPTEAAVETAAPAVAGAVDAARALPDFLSALQSGELWLRVLLLAAGGGLLIYGANRLAGNPAGGFAASAATLTPLA